MDERRPYHRWNPAREYDTMRCGDCTVFDMVSICASKHPADCKCTNPPCPATNDELVKAMRALFGVSHEVMVSDATTTTVTGTITVDPTVTGYTKYSFISVDTSSNVTVGDVLPPERSPPLTMDGVLRLALKRHHPKITFIRSYCDPVNGTTQFYMLCSEHGQFMLMVSELTKVKASLSPHAVEEEIWKRISHCPKCTKEEAEKERRHIEDEASRWGANQSGK